MTTAVCTQCTTGPVGIWRYLHCSAPKLKIPVCNGTDSCIFIQMAIIRRRRCRREPGRGLLLNPTKFPISSPPIFSVLAQRSSYRVHFHLPSSLHIHTIQTFQSTTLQSMVITNASALTWRPEGRRGDSAPKPEPDTANRPPLPSPRPSQSILAPDKRQLRDTSLCRVSSLPAPSNRALRS